jgi:hypothetical protein
LTAYMKEEYAYKIKGFLKNQPEIKEHRGFYISIIEGMIAYSKKAAGNRRVSHDFLLF